MEKLFHLLKNEQKKKCLVLRTWDNRDSICMKENSSFFSCVQYSLFLFIFSEEIRVASA